MTAHPSFKPFNFHDWIARNKGSLKPPVANKQLFDHKTGMTVMAPTGGSISMTIRSRNSSISSKATWCSRSRKAEKSTT